MRFTVILIVFFNIAFAQFFTSQEELLKNTEFDTAEHWSSYFLEGSAGTTVLKDGAFCFLIEDGSTTNWHVQFLYEGLIFDAGHIYRLGFEAFSNQAHTITAFTGMASEPWTEFSNVPYNIDSIPRYFEFDTPMQRMHMDSRIGFFLGGADSAVDNLEVCFNKVSFLDLGGPSINLDKPLLATNP